MGRAEGKRMLRRLREAHGWSWTEEAAAIREMALRLGLERLAATSVVSIRRTLARWESTGAAGTVPDDRYQYVLAHLFAEREGRFELGPASEFRRLVTALSTLGTKAERIAELEEAVMAQAEGRYGSPFFPLVDGVRFDAERLTEVEQSYWMLHRRVGKVPFARSQLALAPFIELCRRVDRSEKVPESAHALAAHSY